MTGLSCINNSKETVEAALYFALTTKNEGGGDPASRNHQSTVGGINKEVTAEDSLKRFEGRAKESE